MPPGIEDSHSFLSSEITSKGLGQGPLSIAELTPLRCLYREEQPHMTKAWGLTPQT